MHRESAILARARAREKWVGLAMIVARAVGGA